MGNHIKAWNVLTRLLFIVVFAISVAVFYLTRSGNGWTDFIINMVFALLAALFLIIYFAGCARPTAKVASALSRVTENITRSGETPKEIWARYSQNTSLFENDRLDDRYAAYCKEMRRLQKQNSLTADCRISDYIDEELIYSTVNKSFCDQLGGIMSGLGILFTFIGLVYGLRNFDATAVDAMQTSTQALMAGIKIAFLTSIFGLIYSLLFGLTYKKLLKDSLETLYDFQDAFEESVRPTNEHGGENALLRLQMEQNAALQTFGANIGTQVSEAIISMMKPTVDTLQSTITQYVNVAIEDQRAGMEKVVRYFLDSMNTSLGNIFVQLKNRTEELARWEKSMIDSISVFTAGLGDTTRGLSSAQEEALRITNTMAEYSDALQTLTTSQQNVIDGMRTLILDYKEMHRTEENYLRSLSDSGEAANTTAEEIRHLTEYVAAMATGMQTTNEDSLRQIADAGRDVSRSADAIRSLSEAVTADMTSAAGRLQDAVASLGGGLSRSLADSISVMDDSIDRLSNALNSVNAAAGNVTQAMKALPKAVSGADTDLKDTTRTIDSELKLLLKAVSDTQKSLTRFNAELARRDLG